ncbi:MAG: LysR family transcriptional regulator [Alphaproteobacteria bacterium]|nr:LysR family transcriptional regulator [Alphaproteobacteria bacterium]
MDFNLGHLRSFLVVARTGNISSAAKELGMTQPNLGRQMSALAKEVGFHLFVRHSRGITLTSKGQEFLELCQRTVGNLEQETDLIREKDKQAQGMLKILTGIGSGQRILGSLQDFSKQYPYLTFRFITVTDISQIKIGDADVGIMPAFSVPEDPDIIRHHLYNLTFKIYASPHYIKYHSHPKKLEDLKSHKLIGYHSKNQDPFIEINNFMQENNLKDIQLEYFIEVNNGIALRSAIVDGLGIGSFWYDHDLIKKKLLIDIFPTMRSLTIPFYYTYHRRLEGSPKVKEFHQFLKKITEPLNEKTK